MSTTSLKGITGSSGVPGPFGDIYGVWGDSDFGPGVFGSSNENSGVSGISINNVGVTGSSTNNVGVNGSSDNFVGVGGDSTTGTGVAGSSTSGIGIVGSSSESTGVSGSSILGRGVEGTSERSSGVFGTSTFGIGVEGKSENSAGMFGESSQGFGIIGNGGDVGVYAHNTTLSGNRNDAYLASRGFAGDFHGDVSVQGNVTVTGDVILTGADCAEEFDIAGVEEIEPGTVMVIDQDGALQQSQYVYDKRVAGVVSGAGGYRPGLILDKQQPQDNRILIALVGKVYCRVDAQYAPIEVGDLLTTSSTPGHAMKADDPLKAFGSVIGKALRPLNAGQGMIPILIALQ